MDIICPNMGILNHPRPNMGILNQRRPQKIVKPAQTNYLRVFDPFLGFVFKELNKVEVLTKFCANISIYFNNNHCVKIVRIRSYSGPYSVQMQENKDLNNSEYGHSLHCDQYQ